MLGKRHDKLLSTLRGLVLLYVQHTEGGQTPPGNDTGSTVHGDVKGDLSDDTAGTPSAFDGTSTDGSSDEKRSRKAAHARTTDATSPTHHATLAINRAYQAACVYTRRILDIVENSR